MKTHELKIWPTEFWPVVTRQKTFEYRRNDRGFEVGDFLVLKEWDPTEAMEQPGVPRGYTSRVVTVRVVYMLSTGFGLPTGFCVLGIERVQP